MLALPNAAYLIELSIRLRDRREAPAALLGCSSVVDVEVLVTVNGTFNDGRILTGSFLFIPEVEAFSQLRNINLIVSDVSVFNQVSSISVHGPSPSPFVLDLYNNFCGRFVYCPRLLLSFNAYQEDFALKNITGTQLLTTYTRYATSEADGADRVSLASGSIEAHDVVPEPPIAVPEPAAWAMMIGSFGVVGSSMRHRRRRTKVTFATA